MTWGHEPRAVARLRGFPRDDKAESHFVQLAFEQNDVMKWVANDTLL